MNNSRIIKYFAFCSLYFLYYLSIDIVYKHYIQHALAYLLLIIFDNFHQFFKKRII